MRNLAAMLMLCLLISQPALAQRMRDMSMPFEESVGQTNPAPPTTVYSTGQPTPPPPGTTVYSTTSEPMPQGPSLRFMEGYCDPHFRPPLASNMISCFEENRKQVCERFLALPPEAQAVLDDSIRCVNDVTMSESPEQAIGDDCLAADARRLQLFKHYWHDQNVSYALLFLPDLVMDAAGRCRPGGGL